MSTPEWTTGAWAGGSQTDQVKGRRDEARVWQQGQTRVFTGGQF